MKAFTTHTGLACPLDRANVDTDDELVRHGCYSGHSSRRGLRERPLLIA